MYNLTLQSTSNATKGSILFGTSAYDEVNNYLAIGGATPGAVIDAQGSYSVSLFRAVSATTDAQIGVDYAFNFNATNANSQIMRTAAVVRPQNALTTLFGLNNNVIVAGSGSDAISNVHGNFLRLSFNESYGGTITNLNLIRIDNAVNSGSGSPVVSGQTGISIGDLTYGTANRGIWSSLSSGSNKWNLYVDGTANNYIKGNISLGSNVFPASATQALSLFNGTVPSAGVADGVVLFSEDLSAGNATLGLRTETAVVTEAVTSDRTLSVKINGTVYKILLKV